ncbi:MAG: Bax inhibitor-1/YccA family protein [Gammaproteobacteria bacterium]
MVDRNFSIARPYDSALATNKVLRNTYLLLGLTLLFSGLTAWFAIASHARPINGLLLIAAVFGLTMAIGRLRSSAWALLLVFALTGFLGYSLGPILSYYLSLPKGSEVVMTALGGTGAIFLGLSGYALTTRKDFSFMAGFLFVGLLVVFLAILANYFLAIPALSLALSAVVILLMSGFILYDTSQIIHGGETNYILATVKLYLDIFNIFVSLLQLLGIFSGDD